MRRRPSPAPAPPCPVLRASLHAQLGGGLEAPNSHFIFSLEAAASWIDSEAAELRRRVYLPFCGDAAPPPALSASVLICSSLTEPRRPATCTCTCT